MKRGGGKVIVRLEKDFFSHFMHERQRSADGEFLFSFEVTFQIDLLKF
jgi:hypothetical protein